MTGTNPRFQNWQIHKKHSIFVTYNLCEYRDFHTTTIFLLTMHNHSVIFIYRLFLWVIDQNITISKWNFKLTISFNIGKSKIPTKVNRCATIRITTFSFLLLNWMDHLDEVQLKRLSVHLEFIASTNKACIPMIRVSR